MLKLGKNSLQFVVSRKASPQIFHYTTTNINNVTSNFLLVDYLVNSLGFSKEEAILTSPKVSSFKSPQKPNSVVNFFKTNGFSEPQIRAVVSSYPKVLSSDVEKSLKPKLKAFHEFGIKGSELGDIVSVHPHIFSRASDQHIVPALQALNSIFEDNSILIEALKKSSWMLAPNIRKNAPLCIALLKSYGFSIYQIKMMFLLKSRYFALNPKWLQRVLIRVEEKIGIPRDSTMFFRGLFVFGGLSEQLLELKFGIFRSSGWTELDILTLARKNPHTLALSELKLRTALDFFMKELGYEPAVIASCSCAFSVSLEKRVIPRNEVLKVLKKKKLIDANYKIFSCLSKPELYFFNRFVLPFKDDVLDVYTDCMTRAGASVPTAPYTIDINN